MCFVRIFSHAIPTLFFIFSHVTLWLFNIAMENHHVLKVNHL